MGFWLFAAFFFLLLIPLALGIVIPLVREHKKATGDVANYDSMMRTFIYKIPLSEAEIISTLQEKNDADELSCDFDQERSVVTISEYGSSREYAYAIEACGGYSVLKLTQVSLIGMQSHIPYRLNPFMVRKLKAELLPYKE